MQPLRLIYSVESVTIITCNCADVYANYTNIQ